MRISRDPQDPGWRDARRFGLAPDQALVTCDGDSYRGLITADEEGGFVLVKRLDDGGKPIMDRGRPEARRVWGEVAIRPRPHP